MITITQSKIAGFEPRWAPFPGFSILFDNPGHSTEGSGSLLKIACSPASDGLLELYGRLDEAVWSLDRDLLIQTYLLCPLPPSSYHVTVWDGINVDNISSVTPALRADWTVFLQGLPKSLEAPPESIAAVTTSELLNDFPGEIGFRFERLTIWGNQVLVARLRPADDASWANLDKLTAARAKLCEVARQELGVSAFPEYSPHVSLGYFVNQEHAQLAHAHLPDWNGRFRTALAEAIITYTSADIYGFTDMASFLKLQVH